MNTFLSTLCRIALLCVLGMGCTPQSLPKTGLHVIATTSHIDCILAAVAHDRIDKTVLVQGGMCPGHFDISPAQVQKLSQADVLIMHGWEKWAADAITAAGNATLTVYTLKTDGNAMVPARHTSMAREIAALLCKKDSLNCGFYNHNLAAYVQAVDDTVAYIQTLAVPLRNVPVVCADHQSALLRWLNMRVVATYGRPEGLTPALLSEVTGAARKAGAGLVVDNLQSGPRAGKALAADLGAAHVTLSNFPLNGSYSHTLAQNVRSLCTARADEE